MGRDCCSPHFIGEGVYWVNGVFYSSVSVPEFSYLQFPRFITSHNVTQYKAGARLLGRWYWSPLHSHSPSTSTHTQTPTTQHRRGSQAPQGDHKRFLNLSYIGDQTAGNPRPSRDFSGGRISIGATLLVTRGRLGSPSVLFDEVSSVPSPLYRPPP